ncbi:MAG TPA: hypothetical protein VFN75_11570 [Pseudonocardiaceae bacterium]|nr:hypothetical protein [Pseudonocardiaceae bacterium]
MTDRKLTQQRHHGNGQAGAGDLWRARRFQHAPPREGDEDKDGYHLFHLLVADTSIIECYQVRQTWVALCGTKLQGSELPGSSCSPDCEREITYCLDCLYTANGSNIDAGLGLRAPGIYVPLAP